MERFVRKKVDLDTPKNLDTYEHFGESENPNSNIQHINYQP
jgi:hypothetical protein